MKHSEGLKRRILLPLIAVGLTVFAIGIYFVDKLENRQMHATVLQEAKALESHLQVALNDKAEIMAASLHFITQNKQILAALRAHDRKALLALATPIYRRLHQENNITHFYFHDAQRGNIVRIHKPEKYGDTINRFTALGAEKSGRVFSGIELGPLGTFTLRTVFPVFDDGKLLGYMELGQEIDSLVQQAHAMFHVQLFMLVKKQYLERRQWEDGMRMLGRSANWNLLSSAVLVSQTLPEVPVDFLNSIPWGTSGIHVGGKDIILQGHRYWAAMIPIKDAAERPVAMLLMMHDMTALAGRTRTDLLLFTGISASLSLLILILFYYILGKTERKLALAREELIKASKEREEQMGRALNIQRVLDTILNISLPPLTLQEVLYQALDEILSIPYFSLLQQGSIFLVAEDGETLEMVVHRNLPDSLLQSCALLPFGKCLCGRAAASRDIVFAAHLNERHEIRYDGVQPHGHYCIPIMSAGRLFGVLNAYVPDGHVSNEGEKRFLKTVADTLAVVIERKQVEEKLQHLAHNDILTGLPNRALFHDRLEQTLALCQRHQQEFALLFLDLDHFKEVNDTYGHDTGDLLLKQAANRLLSCVRKMDTVARMGGDEFTVILTNTKAPEGVIKVARNILKALLEPFELNGTTCHVGCSIGIALYPEHGRDAESLLKIADIAMYDAKKDRNTFCFYRKNS